LPQTVREPSARVSVSPGAAIVAGGGLLLTLTALLAAPRGADDTPSVRLSAEVPDILLLAGATAFALAAVIVMGIGLSPNRRRPELDEELLDRYRRFLALPWWLQVVLRLLPILPLIALLAVFWFAWPHLEESFFAWGRRLFTAPDVAETPIPEIPVVSLPWLGSLLGLLALGVGLASLAAALLLLFAERLAEWWNRRNRLWTAEPLLDAVDESLDDLASEPDARVAIIKCYRRFERVAARARVPRAPWQTSEEFMREALARLALPRAAVERLTRLFEVARFSHHPLGWLERDSARAGLEEIRAALEPGEASLVIS
jgi:Domain of unknown function (DUF4129)